MPGCENIRTQGMLLLRFRQGIHLRGPAHANRLLVDPWRVGPYHAGPVVAGPIIDPPMHGKGLA